MRGALVLATAIAAAAALAPLALAKGMLAFEDTIPSGSSSSVSVTTHRAASFRVLLRVPTAGKAKLYLLGKNAPKGGPLISTSNTSPSGACQGAAGSFYCRGSYEPLPKGKYTWRVTWMSASGQGPKQPAHVELTVRW